MNDIYLEIERERLGALQTMQSRFPITMESQKGHVIAQEKLVAALEEMQQLKDWAQRAASELTSLADELKQCSTVSGEWDGSEEAAREEYNRMMALVAEVAIETNLSALEKQGWKVIDECPYYTDRDGRNRDRYLVLRKPDGATTKSRESWLNKPFGE